MSDCTYTRVILSFLRSESEKYKNDKEYISESLLDKLAAASNALQNDNKVQLFYLTPYRSGKNDPLDQLGHIGFTTGHAFREPNDGMDPELFKELEKEFQAGIRELNHSQSKGK
jgi:hypothetical protein